MTKTTRQMAEWMGDFGRDYTDRNPQSLEELEALYRHNFGINRTELNERFLGLLDRSARILEVGSNVGTQLQCLQHMGFTNLYGIELQSYAVELSKQGTRNINIIQGSAFDIPFKDGFFDMVFTSGVLIHIAPDQLGEVLKEIYRCAKTYIWGFEYWASQCTEVYYRGHDGLLWKQDFAQVYCGTFKDLELIQEWKVPYLNQNNVDSMFLLRKKYEKRAKP